jgi:hypothetical protein
MARATTLMEGWLLETSSGQIPGRAPIRGHHARGMKVRHHRVTISHQRDRLQMYLLAVRLKGQVLVKEVTTIPKNGQGRRGAAIQRRNANAPRLERITVESVVALTSVVVAENLPQATRMFSGPTAVQRRNANAPRLEQITAESVVALTSVVVAEDLPEAARMFSGPTAVRTCSVLRQDHQAAQESSVRRVAQAISVRQEVRVTSGHRAAQGDSDIPAPDRKDHPEAPVSVAHQADPPVGRAVRGPVVPAAGDEDNHPR